MALTVGFKPTTVLVGFAESLAAIESVWMLLEAGYTVAAFSREGAHAAIGRDRRVIVHKITSPQRDVAGTLNDLSALTAAIRPSVLLPLDDDALWLCDAAARIETITPIAGPVGDAANFALDKSRQLVAAARVGLATPPSVVVETNASVDLSVPDAPGPWVIKPALAVAERGGRLIRGRALVTRNRQEMNDFLYHADQPYIVQPRLCGIGEGVFGYADQHGVVGWSAHRRIRMMNPAGSGSSAARSIDPDPNLVTGAERFITDCGWHGLFMLEFLRDESGTPWFMELNGRTWGSIPLARHRGLTYPVWAVRAALNPGYRPQPPRPEPHVVVRHAGRELLHVAFVVKNSRAAHFDASFPTVPRTLRSVLTWRRGDRFYNLQRGAFAVFAQDTCQTVWQQVSDALHRRRAS